MSRSAHQRQQQKLQLQQQQLLAQQMADNEAAAAAAEMFDLFCLATTMRQILGLHRQMCDVVGLRPAPLNEFYPKLKTKVRSWKAQALWKKFDARASHRAYAKGNACTGTRVLVIGAGPCGLRTAIEAQLLGAKVVVLEKRDRISRNNVLHLWPFVITDLRNLGAKKFYGKFCAGSIDHISIRQLQCILLKVALLLGVEIHEGVSFESTIEPSGDGCGWRASITPTDHAVSHYEFDVLIGADGKRNTLEAFKRKEFRGKLAIAITANFINKKTEAEAKAEEISGVAFIFNQSFFKELYHTTGIDLENIVYYKDETHYFVMTAKKHSLIDKGVIIQDFADPAELLASVNVNTEKLLDYAREAAEFSTKYQMPNLEFAVNHYGKPDVAMFDFTSMFAAESSCRVIVRKGFRLLQCLVGDSLLEPFWPTGSGCARGFLSSMDAAYAIKLWSNPANSTLGVMAQRESIYRLLGQTTPENLQRDIGGYTVDPATRYPNLNRTSVNVWQVKHLIDTDDNAVLEQTFMDTNALQVSQADAPVRRKRRSGDTMPLSAVLLRWICAQLHTYEFTKELKEVSDIFTNGKVLCALINRYRPDLVDFNAVKDLSPVEQNDLAFKILEKEMHIPRIMTAKDSQQLTSVESKQWLNYLEQICEVFRGEIPHVKHPKIDFSDLREKHKSYGRHAQPDFSKLLQLSTKNKSKSPIEDAVDQVPTTVQRRSVLDEEKLKRQRRYEQQLANNAQGAAQTDTPRRAKKRRSADKAANIEERQKRLQEIESNRQDRQSKRRQQRYQQTQNFYKSLHMLQANNLLREADENTPFEDYSIFLYRQQAPEFNDRVKELERKLLYPDRERSDIPSALPRNVDEQFSDRIKNMEQRITSRNAHGNDKKPKDLMRAIGKIDSTDWNVREIEKKIEQSKKTEVHGPKGREKVPKWSREQFQARQNKMAKPTRQDSSEEKFREIDQTIKNLDKQLKEGNVLEVGKVASIAGQFVKRDDTSEEKNPPTVVPKSSSKVALAFKKQAASEKCHFCKQTVYLMEKLQCENLVMHRGCLKCHHCHTNLRLGAYAFDRDDPNGRFYCTQHFRLPAKAIRPVVRKPGQRKPTQQQQQVEAAAAPPTAKTAVPAHVNSDSGDEPKTPDKRGQMDNVAKLDLLERGQTPERIEFENTDAMSDGEPSEEHIIDEHEWSGRNFLPESNNDSESDLSSSDESDTESDSDMFEEANDSPLGAQTLQLASEWIGKQNNYSDSDDSDDFYDSSEGMADDGKDDTEGEEFEKARELRREEVRLPPLPPNLPTDTETEALTTSEIKDEPKNVKEVKENKISELEVKQKMEVKGNKISELEQKDVLTKEGTPKNLSDLNENLSKRKDSGLSNASDLSFKSTSSLTNGTETSLSPRTTKADIEKLEQRNDHKFSSDIDAISEKLYRLNNVVKMNKDLEVLAKENLIRSDILKKLSMKEKWLADNAQTASNPIKPKSKFEEKVENFLKPISKFVEEFTPKSKFNDQVAKEKLDKSEQGNKLQDDLQPKSKFNDDLQPKSKFNDNLQPKSKFNDQIGDPFTPKSKFNNMVTSEKPKPIESLLPKSKFKDQLVSKPESSPNSNVLDLLKDLKNKENLPQTSTTQPESTSTNKPVSRTNSFKTQTSASPLLKSKTGAVGAQEPTTSKKPVSRSNSFKNPSASTSPLLKAKTDSKLAKIDDNKMEIENILNIVKKIDISKSDHQPDKSKDMGHLLYKVESKFSPKPNKKMVDKLKEIEAKSFSGTLDSIKSQMETPTVHTAPSLASNVNLAKYFPEQKPEKSSSNNVNKNQKNLNEVDLTKYFPTSPAPQRRSSVVTVADKLKKSQTEKSIAPTTKSPSNERSVGTATKNPPKRQASLGSANYSLKDNQLDGAIDIVKKKPAAKVVTTTVVANNTGKKGNVKIIKKIIRKVTKPNTKTGNNPAQKKNSLIPRDEDDRLLDEILESSNEAQRSPSLEYKQLFQEEKSPSEDISDKIEQILEETGIDLGIPKKSLTQSEKQKKLLKAKSFGEGELQRKGSVVTLQETKEEGDRPSGVQNILKRFESMSSVTSSTNTEHAFKLRRMESTTSNLNKSKESLVSRESDNLSDLEKTMEYLKSEWRTEATNFLQKKRTDFQKTKKQEKEEEEEAKKLYDLPIQYKESKFAKFFGLKQKSPEKRKSPIKKKKSPEKKKSPDKKVIPAAKLTNNKPIIYTSLEELALIKANKESPQKQTFKELETKSKEEKENQIKETSKEEVKDSAKVLQQTSIETEDKSSKELEIKPKVENKISDEIKQEIVIEQELKEDPKLLETSLTEDNNNLKRPLVEDIKNLPKRGCDKSLSSSRRGSQTSLQSRRLSQTSLSDKLELAAQDLEKHLNAETDVPKALISTIDTYDEDSLCTSISKSPSVQPVTVQMRGSSEDESIEKLFSQFSDEMLVNVEFDSNDELVAITPRSPLNKEQHEQVMEDQDILDRQDSWERDDQEENYEIIDLQPSVERDFEQILQDNTEQLENGQQSIERNDVEDNDDPHSMENEFEKILESSTQNNEDMELTVKTPQKLKIPLKTFSSVNNFPTRPQRRQKSLSSSSDSTTTPLAPQRLKKKLSKLSPSNMAPSIQDLLLNVKKNQDSEDVNQNQAKPLKFPRIIDEDDILLDESQAFYKYLMQDQKPNENSSISNQDKVNGSESSSQQQPVIIINDGFQLNKAPENIMEFTKVLRPITPPKDPVEEDNLDNVSKTSLTSEKLTSNTNLKESSIEKLPLKSNTRESSLEWNMEMMPNSPMPPRRKVSTATNTPNTNALKLGSLESLNKLKKMEMTASQERIQESNKISNEEKTSEETNKQIPKENSEISTEKLTTEDILNNTSKDLTIGKSADEIFTQNKDLLSDKISLKSLNSLNDSEVSTKLREKSPTSSIKLLNNIDLNTEASEKRLIEEFELERRHALIERDKQYQVMKKPPKLKQSSSKDSNSSSSKKSTPLVTPSKQSPRDSRRSSMQSSITNRGGSPPMTKPLELPESAQTSEQTSRRSSFAFIEMLGDKAIIAPMPKKLELPKIPEPEPQKPDNLNEAAFKEDVKNRPWPRLQEEIDEEDEDKSEGSKKFTSESIEYANIPLNSGPKREWPDGKTVFNNKSNKTKNPRFYKPRSETPESNYNSLDMELEKEKPSSKSITDLRKLQSPYNSNYSLATSTAQTALTHSSNDSELSSRHPTKAELLYDTTTALPQRPSRYQKTPTPTSGRDDASTQLLLERSKRLHDRKRDFVNERVVERNPYMKDVINDERRHSGGSGLLKYDTDDDDISTYHHHRPIRRYNTTTTSNTSRFPSSRALGRTNLSYNNYDYVPSYTDGSSYSSRRLPITRSSVPTSYLSSNNYHHYNPYTSPALGRSSYLTSDYSRRSPSQLRDRTDLSKEDCVQSESESTSPDEIELNSATEISTDSEFDHDERIRETPKIFIDDTHLRKPTKVQIKSTVLPPSMSQKYNNASINNVHQTAKGGTYLAKYQTQQSQQPQQQQPLMPQFKPLVQVDPSLLQTNRAPLQNPRPGDYLLNKTASTEGIASKKSLELKKRYLLGEPANGNKIQKSGSTSVLDSRIRSFQSNISECQKLLNPSNDISSSMKTFLERTKSGDKAANELMRSATNNILNDLKVEITIQKASSTASTDNEKENVFVNSKNELNKCMESETLNKKSPSTPTNNTCNIIETIDLVTPEKENILDTSDSNKVIDLTGDSPVKSIGTIIEAVVGKPDLSLNVKQCIPDILDHIEKKDDSGKSKETTPTQEIRKNEEEVNLIESNMEKVDVPEKLEALYDNEVADVQIEVPNIAWNTKADNLTSTTNSSCSSSHSSSLEDIEHYILESTTSPETQHSGILGSSGSGNHQVPRLEIHDTSGTLMQIDSLMIIDGKYIGDPEDLKFMDIPEGVIVPEIPAIKTSEIEEEEHDVELEPVTATPEPTETTVIEKKDLEYKEHQEAEEIELPPPLPENGPPLPEKGPPKIKPTNLKFDTKNENKIESLKNLPLIVDASSVEQTKAVKPRSLNLAQAQKTPDSPTTPKGNLLQTPTSPLVDMDKTPTGDLLSKGSDSETEPTNTAQILTETELSDWTADDCISENFVDMDFVHHSEIKSNLKGYKKDKRKSSNNRSYLPTTNEVLQEVAKTAPVAEFEGILKSIDIDDIEFMDTGSDNSNTEPLSATNTALLRNRGYMEFVDTTPKLMKIQINTITTQPCLSATNETLRNSSKELYKPIQCKRDEKLGIDYIEQGAYILQQHLPQHHFEDNNKTPVNEVAQQPPAVNTSSSLMTQSLTDSSTINDLEDESTCNLSSQIHLTSVETCSKPSQQNTTTEESEALTVVTSPFDSSSPQQTQNSNMKKETAMEKEKTGSSTPSSSDRAPKSSQSSTCTNSATSSSKNTPPRQLSKDHTMSGAAKSNDELSYEEYVRALQQKIVQISTTARGDSLETTRKQRRKSSKGEAPLIALTNPNQTVIESATTTTPSNLSIDKAEDIQLQTSSSSNAKIAPNLPLQLNKVPEIPTLSSKLEEITKERTKQKDLIHDLVMDKLQSKKQLNAEKRLHRSRQRSIITGGGGATGLGSGGGYSSGSSLSPTPKLAAANSTTDTNCTNQAHYHVSTAAKETSSSPLSRQTTAQRLLLNTNKPISPSTYVSAYGMEALSPTRANAYKQRPFSEHLEGDTLKAFEHRYKINKTPSFSITTTSSKPSIASVSTAALATKSELSTPIPPLRQKRSGDNSAVTTPTDTKNTNFSVSTENLKSEARARARLKSNSELGLSPEEKMQLLRKRLQTEYNSNIKANLENEPQNPLSTNSSYERQHSLREQKMSNSKSVNDLAYLSQSQLQQQTVKSIEDAKKSDFTSDPNLLLSSTQQQQYLPTVNKLMKSKSSSRRAKDPERRKSLIQSLSNFFHKAGPQQNKDNKQQQKDNTASPSDGSSAHAERPGTGGGVSSSTSTSHTTVSSGLDGVLSRFRISPKSKEKSRDKEDYLFNMANSSCSPTRRLRTSSASMAMTAATSYDCHNSNEFLGRTHLTHTPYSHSQINNLNNNINNNSNNFRYRHHHHYQQQQQQSSDPSKQQQQSHLSSNATQTTKKSSSSSALAFSSSSPQLCVNKSQSMTNTNIAAAYDDQTPPPIPPLPLNYQRSDDESYATETRDQKKQRAISKAVRQAELKRLRIAQEIQREQEEIEVQLKELETRGVLIEKALRGEEQNYDNPETANNIGSSDEKLLKELLEIWRNITQLKKRDEELSIRQQELQLEHRHAQLKEELNLRLSCNKLDKSSADVAAEGAILNEMLEIVAKRAALRPSSSNHDLPGASELLRVGELATSSTSSKLQLTTTRGQSNDNEESNI